MQLGRTRGRRGTALLFSGVGQAGPGQAPAREAVRPRPVVWEACLPSVPVGTSPLGFMRFPSDKRRFSAHNLCLCRNRFAKMLVEAEERLFPVQILTQPERSGCWRVSQ